MNTLQFGPLAIAFERLLAIAALWAFIALVSVGRRWIGGGPGRPSVCAVAVGIAAARLGFVVENWPAFTPEPWTAAYLWQGGFSPLFGVGAAALVLLAMLRGKALLLALAALLTVSVAWFLADRLAQVPPRPLPASLQALRMDARTVSLDSLRGRPFVINLWATWCGPCQREMPMLAEVAATNADVPILIINQGEDVYRVTAFLEREGLSAANILLDPNSGFGRALGSSALPTTAFVSSDGRVTEVHIGEISRAALMSAINELRD